MGDDPKKIPAAAQCQLNPDKSTAADCMIPLERYRVFIEDIGDGFYETNIDGDFVFFNDALCRIFGYPPDEITTQTVGLGSISRAASESRPSITASSTSV